MWITTRKKKKGKNNIIGLLKNFRLIHPLSFITPREKTLIQNIRRVVVFFTKKNVNNIVATVPNSEVDFGNNT